MYNGIGITTPRGTGTNGYVQKNLSFVPMKRERVEYVKDADMKKLETLIEKKGNAEILEHEKKRRVEVKCMEMRDMMLNNGYVSIGAPSWKEIPLVLDTRRTSPTKKCKSFVKCSLNAKVCTTRQRSNTMNTADLCK